MPTAQSAIEHATQIHAESGYAEISSHLTGRCIQDIACSCQELLIAFDSSEKLHVSIEGTSLSLAVFDDLFHLLSQDRYSESEYMIKFPGLSNEPSYHWARSDLLVSRIGKRFRKIFLNDQHLYIYCESMPALDITVLNDVSRNEPVLFWTNSD